MEIKKIGFGQEMVDIMGGAERWDVKIHEHGLCSLIDVMPRLVPKGYTADCAIVQGARVSYGQGTKKVSEDESLIRYLQRHSHSSPTELVEFKFHHIMPTFVSRQMVRTRTASLNEYSARYSVVKDRFYRPAKDRLQIQSMSNKQGGEGGIEDSTAEEFEAFLDKAESLYVDYESLLDKGLARETARIGLPLNVYTEWYWKIDLHNLFRFLALRMDSHAQQEIRDYANAMFELIKPIVPISCKAFDDYNPLRGGMTLSALEIEAIKNRSDVLNTENKRENAEWEEKKKRLNL